MCDLKGGPCIIEKRGPGVTCHCVLKEQKDRARDVLIEERLDQFYRDEMLHKDKGSLSEDLKSE